MTTTELPLTAEEAEDAFLDAGDEVVDRLLEETGAGCDGLSIDAALDDLAGALVEAMADIELDAPPGIAPHSALHRHPDFPLVLAERTLAAMHLRGGLDRSRWGCLLAGFAARSLLLDGEPERALAMSVLALDVGSRSGSPATRLCVGVLAAALGRLGHQDLAAARHLELWVAGVEIEAWRRALAWLEAGPWTDGVWFHGASTCRPLRPDAAVEDPMGRREEQWMEGSRIALVMDAGRELSLRRFGLDGYARRHRLGLAEQDRLRAELEDEAIQQEWLFL